MPRSAANWSASGLDSVSQRAVVSGRRKVAVLGRTLTLLETEWLPARKLAPAIQIDETRFLIEAVAAMSLRDTVRRAKARAIEDRVVWVIDLFARLERRDQLLRGGSIPIKPAEMSEIDSIGDDNRSLAEQHRAQAKAWFESLRDKICAEVEELEREAPAESVSRRACDVHLQTLDARHRQRRRHRRISQRRQAVREDRYPHVVGQRQADAGDGEDAAGRWRAAGLRLHQHQPDHAPAQPPGADRAHEHAISRNRAGLVRRWRRPHADAA